MSIFKVSGTINKHRVGEGARGSYVCFIGDPIIGVNSETGEVFKSTKLYLPDCPYGDKLEALVIANKRKPVEFAVEMKLIRREDEDGNKAGKYNWEANPIIEIATANNTAKFLEMLGVKGDTEPTAKKKRK